MAKCRFRVRIQNVRGPRHLKLRGGYVDSLPSYDALCWQALSPWEMNVFWVLWCMHIGLLIELIESSEAYIDFDSNEVNLNPIWIWFESIELIKVFGSFEFRLLKPFELSKPFEASLMQMSPARAPGFWSTLSDQHREKQMSFLVPRSSFPCHYYPSIFLPHITLDIWVDVFDQSLTRKKIIFLRWVLGVLTCWMVNVESWK